MLRRTDLQSQVDQNTVLCLACSSSLPLNAISSGALFRTLCCQRLICLNCTAANPRLTRYNPCLSCLGGVAVVRSSVSQSPAVPSGTPAAPINLDGSLKDQDVYQIGDDSDDDESSITESSSLASGQLHGSALGLSLSASASTLTGVSSSLDHASPSSASSLSETVSETSSAISSSDATRIPSPPKYYLSKGDTLAAISLRFGVSGLELCLMNKLPRTTLSTTPHLLHTRAYILLPESARPKLNGNVSNLSPEEEAEREAKRVRERAEKKLQTLTKEVDWRVAKAYVALAECASEDDCELYRFKRKELAAPTKASSTGGDPSDCTIEEMALESYLDDEEWERQNPFQSLSAGSSSKPGPQRWFLT